MLTYRRSGSCQRRSAKLPRPLLRNGLSGWLCNRPEQGGAGEKEKAYAIRTNSCLKIVLTLMVLFSITLFVLSQTVFQARRQPLYSAALAVAPVMRTC